MNIFDEVKKDFEKRNALGWELYKKELMPDDDVDWLLNAYEEALDLCVYLKGQLLSRDANTGFTRRDTREAQKAGSRTAVTSDPLKERQSDTATNGQAREGKC